MKTFYTSHGRTVKGGGGRPESESGGTACVGPEWLEALVVSFLSNREMELRVGSNIMIHFLYILLFFIWHMYLYVIDC